MIHCELVRRIFKDIDDRRYEGSEVFFFTLTFLVTFIRLENHQPHRHNCASLVPTDLSDEELGGDLQTCTLN